MSVSNSRKLLEKSISSAVSAIEIYNKPDFKYREETFCILMLNSWELLFKARILDKSSSDVTTIYIKEYYENVEGGKSKRFKYKENRSGNKMTINIFSAINKLRQEGDISDTCFSNIEILVEIRDNAMHFYNPDPGLSEKVLEVGMATLSNYMLLISEWFDYDLSKYNFYLMPISFFPNFDIKSFSIKKRKKQLKNLLKFIKEKENQLPIKGEKGQHISLRINTELVRSESEEAVPLRWTSDPSAPAIRVEEESILARKYPLDFKDLVEKINEKFADFKQNNDFYRLKRELEKKDERYCKERYLDYQSKTGTKKKYYSTEIFRELDKYYTRK